MRALITNISIGKNLEDGKMSSSDDKDKKI